MRQEGIRKASASEPLLKCRKTWLTSEPGRLDGPGISLAGVPFTGRAVSGTQAARSWSAASVRNVGRRMPILAGSR